MRVKMRHILATMLVLTACNKSELQWKAGQSAQDGTGDIPNIDSSAPEGQLVLFNKCSGCHGRVSGGSGNVSDILNPEHLLSSGLAIPSSPDTSPIMIVIANGSMPPTGSLTAQEIAAVRTWIANGLPTSGTNPSPVPLPMLGPTFQSLYANIFLPKCVACHGPTRAEGGVRVDSFVNVRRLVKIVDPTDSKLYKVVNSGEMPEPPDPRLSGNEVSAILGWIQAGAQDN